VDEMERGKKGGGVPAEHDDEDNIDGEEYYVSKKTIYEMFGQNIILFKDKDIFAILDEKLTKEEKANGRIFTYEKERNILILLFRKIRNKYFSPSNLLSMMSIEDLKTNIILGSAIITIGVKIGTVLLRSKAINVDFNQISVIFRKHLMDSLFYRRNKNSSSGQIFLEGG
jgi:hypothetical protein